MWLQRENNRGLASQRTQNMTHPNITTANTKHDTPKHKGKDSLKRDKYSRAGAGACRFVPLSHETFGRAGPAAFALLNEIAEFAAGSGAVCKRVGERHARPCAEGSRGKSSPQCRCWPV